MRYFVAVAEELNFHRAAERLHISQPSLSHQIRELERRLGVSLLIRTSRPVELTPTGQTLLDEGRELLAHAERVLGVTRGHAERLTVGFYGSAAMTLLPETLRTFDAEHPGTDVSLQELLFGQIDELMTGKIDVAFTRLLPGQLGPNVTIEVLDHEPRLVALPRTHHLADRRSITFHDLRHEAFITNPAVKGQEPRRWLAEQERHGLPRRVAAQAASTQELLTSVAAGRGISLVPLPLARHCSHPDVRFVAVDDADPAVVSIARHQSNARPIVDALIAAARQAVRAHHPTA